MCAENADTLIKQGAEAKLYVCTYLGKRALIKERFKKNYRHPDLDTTITKERMKNEARAIVRCKYAAIRTPSLYLVDFEGRKIYMEYFDPNITVKDFIIQLIKQKTVEDVKQNDSPDLDVLSKCIGETVRKMHDNNIIHGDLTTSNMLLVPKIYNGDNKCLDIKNLDLVIIDFGLSYVDSSVEDKGVDLYVLERAVISTHNELPELFDQILEAYKNFSKKNVNEIVKKFEEVRARGRKRTMVG